MNFILKRRLRRKEENKKVVLILLNLQSNLLFISFMGQYQVTFHFT